MTEVSDIDIEEGIKAIGFAEARYETPLPNQRESTHGDYTDTARIAWRIKNTIRQELVERHKRSQPQLTYRQLESLDMIATKIARIISGDASNTEHWEDIAGYAKLIVEA